jgi:NAD(P)H-flavin reductase
MAKYKCKVCGYIFDEEKEQKKFSELASDWVCPECGVGKDEFEEIKEGSAEFIGEIFNIKSETADVKTFMVESPPSYSFHCGQYCMVSFVDKPAFSPAKKPFTFSNITSDSHIELTVKQVGEFTGQMHKLSKGDKLRISEPKGEAYNFDESIKDDIVFLAGGAGITPFISIMKTAAKKGLSNKFYLFYGNRTSIDIIFKDELELMKKRINLTVVHVLQSPDKDWEGEKGFITKDLVAKFISQPTKSVWYICGPPLMNSAMKQMLYGLGVTDVRIKLDKWEIPGKK